MVSRKTLLPPKGLLLDLDGTLADTIPALRAVYHEFLLRRGAHGTDQEFEALAGCSILSCMEILRERYHINDDARSLAQEYYGLVDDLYATRAEPMPGARRLLAHARERDLRVAVVTSSPERVAAEFLGAHGLADKVQTTIGAGDTPRGKPHPEPYEEALRRLGLKPAQAVAVEDSEVGASSALAAGVATFLLAPLGAVPPRVPGMAGALSSLDELIVVLERGLNR